MRNNQNAISATRRATELDALGAQHARMPRLPLLLVIAALLAACAGRPDAEWVIRPEGGGPTLIEQVSNEDEGDPVGTAFAIGQLIGQIALIILFLAGGG